MRGALPVVATSLTNSRFFCLTAVWTTVFAMQDELWGLAGFSGSVTI
jgi:hypothetical protein